MYLNEYVDFRIELYFIWPHIEQVGPHLTQTGNILNKLDFLIRWAVYAIKKPNPFQSSIIPETLEGEPSTLHFFFPIIPSSS